MAEEQTPGQGWSKSGDNSFIATFSIPKTRQSIDSTPTGLTGAISPTQQIRVIVNNKTGAIDLYKPGSGFLGIGDGKPFSSFSPATGQWSVADPKVFNEIGDAIGPEGILKLRNDAKRGSVSGVINPTSTNEDKAKISSTEGYKSLSNTINQDPNQDSQPLTIEGARTNLQSLSNLSQSFGSRDGTRKVNDYQNLIYPKTLRTGEQDTVRFTMLEYSPKKLNADTIREGGLDDNRGDRTRGGIVTLPIQPSISDNNTVNWASGEMSAPEIIGAAAAYNTILESTSGAVDSLQAVRELFKDASPDIKNALAAGMAGRAVGVGGLLTRVTGGIVNPNMELLFNGPQLRSFNFNFVMSAREEEEAVEIKKIIRFFKQGMSVKRAATNLFLKSPHTFEIKYFLKDKENHPWINQIKECALVGCSVNYTPAGTYSTYEDGAMTMYELSLQFSELEPIYDDNYAELVPDGNSDTHIGF